ncbi:histidine phosphatase family protein [Roseomonas sp. SSH11]|uniref:Histidine phosphatase family protein n=1 Tax=Pararoseomonas baculiformis TaxID=2820812 RepID=A0ABS4ACU4_9PROT|nr:histidine phosphatase family protein [Pararoseomonas baculiformis]MBP0444830.1 histidine phosphatase family protein [Pararoseomonas baculiformis]
MNRRALLALSPALLLAPTAAAEALRPTRPGTPEGDALVARLRQGGLVMFLRHADTRGEPCDRSFRVGDRAGQRNISPAGRDQSAAIGRRLAELGIPVEFPVPAGPVFRARDTAEAAFGAARVRVTDELLADDFAHGRLEEVLAGHRRLLSAPVAPGVNRVLVGHRTPLIMVAGPAVGGRAFPEGAFAVVEPGGSFRVLGILELAPLPGGGFHGC